MIAERPPYRITDSPSAVDVDLVHGFLSTSYWARGIPRETLVRAIENSLCFTLQEGDAQIGFARIVTDHATFAYVADVFVIESRRRLGLARWLLATAMSHPELQGLRRWLLVTRDAHGLYRTLGFTDVADPNMILTLHDPDIYVRGVGR